MTLKQIKYRIRTQLGLWKAEGYDIMPEDVLENLANQAQVLVRIDLRDLIEHWQSTFTANKRSYAFPSDYLDFHQLRVDATSTFVGYEMFARNYRDLVEEGKRFDTTPGNDRPKYYTIRSDNFFEIDPLPGSSLRFDLWYIPSPSDMTTDTDQPDFKTVFHEIVYKKTLQLAVEGMLKFANLGPEYERQYNVAMRPFKALANQRESRMTRPRFTSIRRN